MKKMIGIFVLLIPSLALAEPASTPSKFDQLREKRPEIHAYYTSLLIRSLANDVAIAMSANGFSNDDIQKIVNGRAFQSFSTQVLESPRTKKALDRFLNRLLKPGVLEATMQKKRRDLAARQQASLAMAVEELVRAQQRILPPESKKTPPTIWQKIWRYLSRDLL